MADHASDIRQLKFLTSSSVSVSVSVCLLIYFLNKYILRSKASFHSHSYLFSISLVQIQTILVIITSTHCSFTVCHIDDILIQCNHSFIMCVCVCVCVSVCVCMCTHVRIQKSF